jgi:sulfite dehydrogenase (cytochrome) subunit B
MTNTTQRLLMCGLLALSDLPVPADEAIMLRDAPGRDVVEGYCGACHSLAYPRTNSVFLDRKGWQSEVDKMIKAYGAPIGEDDAKVIVDYLTANYGTAK